MKRRKRLCDIDLTQPDGYPVTTGQLARYVGVSRQTIRRELQAGELHGYRVGLDQEWRVTWDEARKYCERIGRIESIIEEVQP